MKSGKNRKSGGLRSRTELCPESDVVAIDSLDDKDPQFLIHELQVHKIELEMQKEELLLANREIEKARLVYQDLYDNAPVGYLSLDQKGYILKLNLTAASILGGERNSHIRRPLASYFSSESCHAFELFRQRMINGKDLENCEVMLENTPTGRLWLLVEGQSYTGTEGCFSEYRMVLVDITERKLIEESLRNSEKLYRAIGESIDYGVWVCTPDGRNIYASDSFLELVGISQEQCSDFGWGDTLHPDDAERTILAWKECICSEGLWDIEHRFRGLDGQWHPILARGVPVRNDNGDVTCWAGINLDMSRIKKVEEELRQRSCELEAARAKSENDRLLLLAVMEALPVGVAITDANGGNILSNNAYDLIWAGPRPLPRSIDEYSAYKAWWPDSGASVAPEEWASAIAVRKGETTVGQLMRIQRFDGSEAFVINSASPVRDVDGNIIGCAVAIQDITDLKMAEEALRENELKASALINAAGESVWMFCHDGKILAANVTAARRIGSVPEEIIGRYWKDLIPAELVASREKMINEVFQTGLPVHFEDTRAGMCFDHSIYPVRDRSGNITSVALFSSDVTTQKNAEEALRVSREDLNRAQEVGKIGSWRLDVRGNVLTWSDENHRIFGTPKGTPLTYENFLDCVHPDDRTYVDTNWKAALLSGVPYDIEHRLMVDGRCKWVLEKAYLEFEEDGTLIGGFGITQDISKRKEVEEELQKAHNELEVRVRQRTDELATTVEALLGEMANRERAEKVLIEETLERVRAEEVLREKEQMLLLQNRHAAMGEMIGNIAHQWRQPLNTLGLITQRLGVFYGSPSFNKELLDTSVSKSMEIINHMSRTIDDFRNFFSTEREKSEFRVNDALIKALSLVEANFKDSGIKIIHNEIDEISIYGFPNEYAQVLLNIFINAKDAINERKIESPCLTVSICNENCRSVVTIADNAGGIPEDIIEKVFDPYFTTKGPQQGTGVGLFMSKTIIEKNMGGRLSARNTATGAEFRIEV